MFFLDFCGEGSMICGNLQVWSFLESWDERLWELGRGDGVFCLRYLSVCISFSTIFFKFVFALGFAELLYLSTGVNEDIGFF